MEMNIKQTSQLNKKENISIAIIGAGASGLFTAIHLATHNTKITLFEKNNKIGKKLLATGNGRCNISNKNIQLKNFYSHSDITKIKPILQNFNFDKCKKTFQNLGIEFADGENNRVYPMSQTASSVVEALEFEALQRGVIIKLNNEITSIVSKNNRFILNDLFSFDKVIIAQGSIAMPKLGSSHSGYDFATFYKHTLIKPFASLVQLISDNKHLDIISGVKIQGLVQSIQGDILFTKYGVSGSAILDISRDISYKLQHQKNIQITIDTLPAISKNQLVELLLKRVKILGEKDIFLWLDGLINKKLAKYIILNSNIASNIKFAKFLNRKDILKIVHTLKNLQFNIIDTKGFESCEVCAGGISLDEINLNTMESKYQKNLYFTGEVLDIDADCGGFNLHWAWASGYTLALGINKNL